MTETLLINFLFLLFPVLGFLIFSDNRDSFLQHRLSLYILPSIAVVLCMTFPIKFDQGFIFDLRYIPFILMALFGGYRFALPIYITINIYRFFIGDDGVLLSFIYSTAYFLLIPYFSARFHKANFSAQTGYAFGFSLFVVFTWLAVVAFFFEELNLTFWMIALNVTVIQASSILILMILIGKIRDNVAVRDKLLDTERLNLSSELSASIAHELRNPLTVTSGFLQLLHQSNNIDSREKNYIDYSLKELRRAEEIVNDYLSLAKPQAKNMIKNTMKEEIDYVNNVMQPFSRQHNVSISYQFTNELLKTYDKNQFRQCLMNLYKNGIEAMSEKGGTLQVEVLEENKNILISIKDSGIGMSKEEVKRIGKPYYSTKLEGTGLGMMMVYSTVNKLGGQITILSEKGVGTTFHLTIPADTDTEKGQE